MVASIFRDSFDQYSGSTQPVGVQSKWTSVNGNIGLTTGRFGGQAATCGNAVSSASMDSAVSSFSAQFGYSGAGSTGRTYGIVRFRSGTTYMVGVGFNADGSVFVARETGLNAGTILGTSAAGVVPINTYVTIDFECVISDTVGEARVYVDSTLVLSLSNVDTRNGTPTTVNTVVLGDGVSAATKIDDLIVISGASKLPYLLRAETIAPDSDGATLNLVPSTGTSHFAVVDELPASATDYLSGSTAGELDLLGLSNLASTPDSIQELVIVGLLQKTDVTARSMALGVKSGATTSDGANFALNASGLRHERVLDTDPDTSAAWTAAAVNALQVQPKVTV